MSSDVGDSGSRLGVVHQQMRTRDKLVRCSAAATLLTAAHLGGGAGQSGAAQTCRRHVGRRVTGRVLRAGGEVVGGGGAEVVG